MGNLFSVKAVKCFFLIVLLFIAHVRFITAQWVKQSPIPTGQEINDVCFINPDTGWIFGCNGTVLRTNNGGVSWIDQSIKSYSDVYVGLFLDSNLGWIALSGDYQDDNGKIYGTTNGGYTWNLQFLDNTCTIKDMSFINPDTGWALAYYRKFDPVPKYQNFFLKTIDGGDNWFVVDSLDESHFRSMDFINDTLGYIAGPGIPNLMKTVDGGMSWQAAQHASNAGLNDVFFTDILNGYSCGNNFYYTHNGGASWNFTYCYQANSVEMYDESNGWAFSINKVYKVSNGGLNVDYQFSVDKSFLADISVVDSANAYIVGKDVTIFATHDGATWQEISNGTHNDLCSVFFLNENDGWACGSGRTILSTHDGGKHWIFNEFNLSSNVITGIQFINHDTGWLVNGEIYRSIDGGLSWSQTSGLSYPVSDLYFLDAQLGWCAGPEGRLFKSMDGGITWEEKYSGTVNDLNAVYFIDESSGWIAEEGKVKKTTDGGETWQDIIPEGMIGASSLEDLCFIDQDTGYLCGSNYLLQTIDGGKTWISKPCFPAMHARAIFFTDKLKGWIVGEDGMIFHTENGGDGSVANPEDEPSPYIIFPNPSRNIFSVKYRLEVKADVEIGIYNLNGTKIIYNKETGLNPGNYSFDWDPALLPSGIYLCKIRIGEYSNTEKMVYIK